MHTATAVPSLSKIEMRAQALSDRRAYARSLPWKLRGVLEQRLLDMVMPHLGTATAIAGYHPMKDEIDPLPILNALASSGHITALPWFASRHTRMMFREAPAGQPGPWGVLQPEPDAAAVAPEIVLVPLVAADARCNRIGYGKGHYDRALAHLRENGALRTIGLAWDMQVLEADIPADAWDIPLDAIATPDRWLERKE